MARQTASGRSGRDDVMTKVAMGAAGTVLVVGAVAAGAALMNRKTRGALTKRAKSASKEFVRVGKAIGKKAHGYQAIAHKIGMSKSKNTQFSSSAGKTKSRKKAG